MLPEGAVLERVLYGMSIYDVSALLPRHQTKRYQKRDVDHVGEVYVHHSGKLGKPGYEGLALSARYSVLTRGWPGCPYHLWIPYAPDIESDHLVVYRANWDDVHTWHAGKGPNERGVAIALQGNTTVRPPSDDQLYCLYRLLEWYQKPVLGHCEAGQDGHPKPSCPGTHCMTFLAGWRMRG